MENKLTKLLQTELFDRKVLILGFGREGRESLKAVLRAGSYRKLAIADERTIDKEKELFLSEKGSNNTNQNIEFNIDKSKIEIIKITQSDLDFIDNFDIVFKSPGIVLPKPFSEYKPIITSQTEYFLKAYGRQTIGITGTKGKSTTTTLIYHELKENGFDTLLGGNIGVPVFTLIDLIKPDTNIVFEISCHQLEYASYSPHIAVYLNVFPEHLDHYGTFEKYKAAKENIYKSQKEDDKLYCGTGVIPSKTKSDVTVIYDLNRGDNTIENKNNLTTVEKNLIKHKNAILSVDEDTVPLKGFHNLFDIAVAFAVCSDLGVSSEGFNNALKTYKPLPHRLEFIGEYDKINFYDDSISTIPETAIAALKTLKDLDTILIGGMDRGIDYTKLIKYLEISVVPNIILMEATGSRITKEIKADYPALYNSGRVKLVKNLEEAVKLAKELTRKGKSCVMSPAAASYGIFKNFEERGEVYKNLVKEK